MNFSIPSFGRKDPINNVRILNTDRYHFETATVYKVDAKDVEDSFEFSELDEDWAFKDRIATDVDIAYMNKGKHNPYQDYNYYLMKNKEGTTLGIAETVDYDDSVDLSFISTKPESQYKYVGQTLLASIAQDIRETSDKDLTVSTPTYDAFEFYTDVCGFNSNDFGELRMPSKKIINFLNQTEERTQSQFVNYTA